MTKALLVAAALGLSVAGANACEYMRSASTKVDNTTVASTTQSMSRPTGGASTDRLRVEPNQTSDATVPAEKDG